MLIISDFHDYYDSAIGYGGVDKTIVYNRKQKKYKFDEHLRHYHDYKFLPEYEHVKFFEKLYIPFDIFYRNTEYGIHNISFYNNNIIFFCGELYTSVHLRMHIGRNYYSKHCYNIEEVKKTIVNYGNKKDLDLLNGKSYCFDTRKYIFNIDRLNLFFNNTLFKDIILQYHQDNKCPIIMYSREKKYNKQIIFNPCLKDFQFAQIYDPFQAFQKIEMFISGVLGTDQKKLIQINDNYQRDKKGFDDRSFKNMPRN